MSHPAAKVCRGLRHRHVSAALNKTQKLNCARRFQPRNDAFRASITQSIIELSRTQDEEVGDGTTSVIILGASKVQCLHTHQLSASEAGMRHNSGAGRSEYFARCPHHAGNGT